MSDQRNDPLPAELVDAVASKRVSRREFLSQATALGVSLTVAEGLLSRAAEAAVKKGGRLRVGVNDGSVSDSLDPATTNTMFMILQNHSVRSYLSEIGPDNALVPELAESWETSQDAATWHFKLRKGVEFHNGKTLDSRDVVDSIDFHRKEDSRSAAKALFAAVTEVKADGPDALTVELEAGNADFPYLFTDYHVNILPSDGEGQVDWQSGTGTGAYVMQEFEPGVRAFLTRNPNYWKADRGNFDEAELLALTDQNARLNALRTGEADVIDQPDFKTVALMTKQPDIELDNVTGWAHVSMPMHMDTAPFDNPDVRLALKHAIDREDVVQRVFKGYGKVGNDHPISPVIEYHAELEQRQYDPDRAKFHLKQAGLESLTVSLSSSEAGGAGTNDTAVLFAAQAGRAGITVDIVKEPSDGFWTEVWLKKPFCIMGWGGRPTADVMFTTAYAEAAPWNDSRFSHERFNELLVAARGEVDSALRAEMYREMQLILRDEGSAIIPVFRNLLYLRHAKVRHGPNLSANWQFDGARAVERWWFA